MQEKLSNRMPSLNISGGIDKIVEFDLMKFYGILLVIFGHVVFCYTSAGAVSPAISSEAMVILKNIIYSFHMPMFVFVSGAVFAYQLEIKKREYSLVELVKKKFKRLMVPYYIFSLLWVLPTMSLLHLRQPFIYARNLLFGIDPRHLWYVMMLFEAFIFFYFLRWLCQKLHLPYYCIVLVSIVLYVTDSFVILPKITEYFQINSLLTYFLWFVLGYFFVLHKRYANCVAFGAVVMTILSLCYNTFAFSQPILDITFAITGITLFYVLSLYTKNIITYSWYKLISRNSFGIYLFHAMIIYMLEYMCSSYKIKPIILSILIFIAALIFSIIMTKGVRRFNLGVIIGE